MDAFAWAETMAENLKAEFSERLFFVGLQGSRVRGEAHDQSDINLVVLLDSLCKGTFFILQVLHFARTDEYPHTKSELSRVLEGNKAYILGVNRNWETHRPESKTEQDALANLLLNWSEAIMLCEFGASQHP